MIKAVLFDYAGVITPTRDNYLFAKKYHARFGMEVLPLMHMTYEEWDKALVGEISDKEYWGNLGKRLNIKPEDLKLLIVETFPIDQRMIKLIDSIHSRLITVMVSNQVEDWLEKAIDDNNLRTKFDYFVNSYHVKAKKPDSKIFQEALRLSNVEPDEALFIDDNSENVAAAKKLGINAIQLNDFETFIQEFKKYIEI